MTDLTGRRIGRAARRQVIEEAATRLFAERGYSSTTVEDIARAAGVTKPILYRHYESKQELCVALLERYRDELVAAPLSVFKPAAPDWRVQLAAMGDAWLGYIEQHPEGARLLLTPICGDPEVERVQHELHSRQRETQTALLREFAPDVEGVEAEALGEALRAAFVAVALWRLDNPDQPRESALRALLRVPEGILMTLSGGDRS